MLKRLDWLDVHGHDGGNSSDGSDSSSGSSSHESDCEISPEPESPQALGRIGAPKSGYAVQAVKQSQAVASSAARAAAVAIAKQTVHPPKRQRFDSSTHANKQETLPKTTTNDTAHVSQPAHIHHLKSSEAANEQETSSGSEQPVRENFSQQHSKKQNNQLRQQKAGQEQNKAQMETSSGSDTDDAGSDDEDIAEYKREMMLGRHISSSNPEDDDDDDDAGTEDDGDASDAAAGVEGDEGEPELQVEEVERNWAEAKLSESVQGVALRCVPCRALLLNAQTYRTHMASKKHLSAMKHWDTDTQVQCIVFATDAPGRKSGEDEGETHAERLQRLKQQLAAENAGLLEQVEQQNRKSQGRKKRQHRQATDADSVNDGAEANKKHSKKGRRERAAAKAAALSGDKKKDKHHNAAAQRRRERREMAAAAAAARGKG